MLAYMLLYSYIFVKGDNIIVPMPGSLPIFDESPKLLV